MEMKMTYYRDPLDNSLVVSPDASGPFAAPLSARSSH
jgi:hypothetical protein